MLEVRKTNNEDLKDVMEIINDAKRYFRENGIDQWQTGYPDAETIRMDINAGQGYVLVEDGQIIATSAIIDGIDPNYAEITNGAWLNEGSYIVIHRTAVRTGHKGIGMANLLYEKAVELAKEKGIRSLRADTHANNQPMRRLMKKLGFKTCGLVYMKDGTPRIAYQKML